MAELDVKSKIEILKDTALKNIEKKYGKEKYYLGERKIPKVPLICSSGSLSLDQALCIGGFPEGRLIEIGGQESSGKSTLTLLNIAEIQRNGKVCAYLDVEQSFDPIYATRLGVDVYNLAVFQPETMEETFEMLFELLSSKVVSYIVVDSTNAMIPKRMLEGDTDTSMMGKSALLMSQQLPKVVSLAASNSCTVVFLSQIRSKIGVVYGSPEKIGVGESMKFYASIRIKTSKTEIQKDDGDEGQSSVDIVMMVTKNKVGAPFKKAQFTLLTGADGQFGIDTMKEVIDFAIKYDLVKKAGSWYSYGEEKLGQGMPNVKKFFTESPDKFTEVKEKILAKLAEEREKDIAIIDSFSNVISNITEDKPSKRRGKKEEDIPEEIKAVMDEEEIKEAEVVTEEK
jgi:recombination protein RecA